MDGSKNKTWIWVALIVLAVLALSVAYYYYNSAPRSSDTTGENAAEEQLAEELNALKLGDLESGIGDIEKELAQ